MRTCWEARGWNSQLDGIGNNLSPGCLTIINGLFEEVIQKEIVQFWIFVIGLLNVSKEDWSNDTSTSPHESNATVVQLPIEYFGGLTQKHEPLGVGHDFGSVQGFPDVFNEFCFVSSILGLFRTLEDFTGSEPFSLEILEKRLFTWGNNDEGKKH